MEVKAKMEEIVLGKGIGMKTFYENYADEMVAKYAILKYPHYLDEWEFDPGDYLNDSEMHDIALFSMIVHRHHDKKDIIMKGIQLYIERKVPMSASFLVYGSLDEFPIPSDGMIDYIKIHLADHDPVWSYCVTGWYIMNGWIIINNNSDHDEKKKHGLKFAKDHQSLAKRAHQPMFNLGDDNDIELFIKIEDEYIITFNKSTINTHHSILYRNHCLHLWEPTLDNACLMGCFLKEYEQYSTYDWLYK